MRRLTLASAAAENERNGYISRREKKALKELSWPQWWEWELEFTPHLLKRMEDRSFNEVDLRTMLEHARAYRPDIVDGRWVIETRHNRRPWEVIVEPERDIQILAVVTAYPVWE